jgi:hypothetical protein
VSCNLPAVNLCDTSEHLSPRGYLQPFWLLLRRLQTPAGAIADIMGMGAIMAAVAITGMAVLAW